MPDSLIPYPPQYLVGRVQRQGSDHHSDNQRLRDCLVPTYGQRYVLIGKVAAVLGHEHISGNARHGIQHPGVAHVAPQMLKEASLLVFHVSHSAA